MQVLLLLNNWNECSKLIDINSFDAGIQDSSTSISIVVKFEEMSELDDDESDKHI